MIENILLIKHGSLGDIIRSSGIIEAIRKKHNNSKIFILTSHNFIDLMLRNPNIDEIIIDDRKPFYNIFYFLNLKKTIDKYNFGFIYDLQNSQRTFIYKKILLKNAKWISTNREKHPISGIQGLIDMLKKNKIPTINTLNPNLNWLTNNVRNLMLSNKIKKKFILLIPGSSKNHPEKRWPYYSKLIELLAKENYQVVSILGPDELDLEINLSGIILKNLSWGDLAGIINASSFIISNDTGPIHIAACLKKKGLIIFGPSTSSIKTGLNDRNFNIINSRNLQKLKPSQVYSQLKKIINF